VAVTSLLPRHRRVPEQQQVLVYPRAEQGRPVPRAEQSVDGARWSEGRRAVQGRQAAARCRVGVAVQSRSWDVGDGFFKRVNL
jgi:hypothetical protein